MRIIQSVKELVRQRDYTSIVLFAAISLIAFWTVCLLFVKPVQVAALNRYHLQSQSFLCWSVQQIIPSIYNFENQFEFASDSNIPDPKVEKYLKTLNHFPLRVVTYFEGRVTFLDNESGGELRVRSRYRGQEVLTQWRLDKTPAGFALSQQQP